MKLWTGRLDGSIDDDFAQLNNSLPFDQQLARQDIQGSIAWAKALARAGLLVEAELKSIIEGLEGIAQEFASESFQFRASDEDIHTAVERRLTEKVGAVAGKLHTGRSRNDQVATDFRLWVMEAIKRVDTRLIKLQSTLVARAESDMGVILPGYTHLQQAQPILLSHWWLSHFWALQRDRERFRHLDEETRVMPLGSGALAGTGFLIDRVALAVDLGFNEPSANSLDAIADRDFAAGFLFCACMTGIHLSRMAETLILFSTQEFGFVVLADDFSTGSSLMPQKKNPDSMELIRGKSGVLTGKLMGLLATLKGLPSTYDKDLQEDKLPVFESADILEKTLSVMSGAVATLTVQEKRMLDAVNIQVLATDLADYLVEKGVPFRQAHHLVGKAVKYAETNGKRLVDLSLQECEQIDAAFTSNLSEVFDVRRSLARRASLGGTAPQAVLEQIKRAKEILADQAASRY